MQVEHLYTVMIRVYQTQEVFIDQFRTTATHLNEILFAWVAQAVARGFIKGTDDPKVPFRDITERNKRLEPLDGVFNIWRISFLIGKDFYVEDVILARHSGLYSYASRDLINCIIDFIKTSTAVSLPLLTNQGVLDAPTSRALRKALEKYEFYKEQHERLKGNAGLSKAITKERKRVEKQLLYWSTKQDFLRQFYNKDAEGTEKHKYTVNFNYERYHTIGVWTYQLHIVGADINHVFHDWVSWLMYDTCKPDANSDHREQIINDQDRLLLMEKVSSGYYAPVPIAGCVNVWSTYFSLSAGMAKITIIKTALDEVVQG